MLRQNSALPVRTNDMFQSLESRMASDWMGMSVHSLLPKTRQLLELMENLVNRKSRLSIIPRSQVRLTQQQLRTLFGWQPLELSRQLTLLVSLEFVVTHPANDEIEYELLYNGEGRDESPSVLNNTAESFPTDIRRIQIHLLRDLLTSSYNSTRVDQRDRLAAVNRPIVHQQRRCDRQVCSPQ